MGDYASYSVSSTPLASALEYASQGFESALGIISLLHLSPHMPQPYQLIGFQAADLSNGVLLLRQRQNTSI